MKQKDISVGVTAFIDILGFGDRVVNAESIEDINDIHNGIRLIQDAFNFNTKDTLTRDVQKLHRTTVLAFSDCVVVNIPLESEATKYDGTFDPIMSEITSFAYGQGICCLKSLFIRGGLDLGWWYRRGSTLISQSMVNAYKTESTASIPVVALTNRLYDYFEKHTHRSYYSKDFDPIPRIFRRYQDGNKEFLYIDYMTICLESVGWCHSPAQLKEYRVSSPEDKDRIMSEGYRHNIDEWLSAHARNIEAAHIAANDRKVRKKYEWLSIYHNEIAQSFTTNAKCQCVVQPG